MNMRLPCQYMRDESTWDLISFIPHFIDVDSISIEGGKGIMHEFPAAIAVGCNAALPSNTHFFQVLHF